MYLCTQIATFLCILQIVHDKGFYESVGFRQSSDTFMLDGIPHIKMIYILTNSEKSLT